VAEHFDVEDANRMFEEARAVFREMMPHPEDEGEDLAAEELDALRCNDEDLFIRTREEGALRGQAWERIGWFWHLTSTAGKERDMRLMRSATRSIRLASEAEFQRRSGGEAG
jgi:hypothetical protein